MPMIVPLMLTQNVMFCGLDSDSMARTQPIFEKRFARLDLNCPRALSEVLNLIEQLEQEQTLTCVMLLHVRNLNGWKVACSQSLPMHWSA